jgi:hypothetical protein
MTSFFGRRFGYHAMNSTQLLNSASKNLNNGRWQNVTRALRILNSRYNSLTNNQRNKFERLAIRASRGG